MKTQFGLVSLLLVVAFCAHALPQEEKGVKRKVTPKGKRTLGLHVGEAEDKDYGKALQVARSAGVQATSLSLNWNAIETEPGKFKNELLSIANAYYPPQKTALILVLRPIDTNRKQVPSDLTDRPFEDPEMIARFNKLLDFVFSQIPDLTLTALAIGNEVDITLGKDKRLWEQYKTFYKATSDYARKKRPGLKVGVATTLTGAKEAGELLKSLNEVSDVVMLSYYPLKPDFTVQDPEVVAGDFDRMARLAAGKPVVMTEVGYPSGPVCKSSEAKQAEFVRNVFRAWDAHAAQIPFLAFSWQTDISKEAVEGFARYYGVNAAAFKEYLLTLGLRHREGSGKDKEAFEVLKVEARARGW
jgi:hypothetical protein